jgi:hypothetical protein
MEIIVWYVPQYGPAVHSQCHIGPPTPSLPLLEDSANTNRRLHRGNNPNFLDLA